MVRSKADKANHVIRRGARAFALLNRYPYNNGHLLVAPIRHVGELHRLQPAEWQEMFMLASQLVQTLRRTLRAQGFNLGLNLGRVAGAGIPGHLHLHIVPRWNGDTNFMPVFSGAKVISQSLDEVHRLLAKARDR
jgi:ATP adenylyltransferase